jgi:hypothetical protein
MKKLLLINLVLFVNFVFAQKPCETDSKYNEFDFWIGNWEVYGIKGKLAGTSKISKILDNCVLLEEWTSSSAQQGIVFSGKSYNSYNSATKQWQQTWVDNTGGTTEYLIGHFENDAMYFLSRAFPGKNGLTNIRKLTFFKLKDNRVRQLGEISNDEGKTWNTEFDLEYRKIAN